MPEHPSPDDDDAPAAPESPTPPAPGPADLDADDYALLSLGSGLAGFAFAVVGIADWTHMLALPCGLCAIGWGHRAVKQATHRPGAALCGLGIGALTLAIWLVTHRWMNGGG